MCSANYYVQILAFFDCKQETGGEKISMMPLIESLQYESLQTPERVRNIIPASIFSVFQSK